MRLRNVVLIVLFLSSAFVLAEESSDCWWYGCRVSSQRADHKSRTVSIHDIHYDHIGMPTRPIEGAGERRPEAEAKKNFIILECEPYKNLQEGDILLQVGPISKDPSDIYDLLMLSPHAAIVAKKPDGSLFALGTPRNYWEKGKLNHVSYHVIRLREYPAEITSPQMLQEWKSNPVKFQKIRDWQEKRKEILAKVKKGIEFFDKNPPYYDSWRETQILDPKQKEYLTKMIFQGEAPEGVPSQYCSELVATIYSVAGAQLPKIKTNQFYIDRLEKEVLPFFKKTGESDAEVFQRGLDAFFNNTELWSNLGVEDEEKEFVLEARKKTGNTKLLPGKVDKLKKNIEWVWSYPAFIRNQLVYWNGSLSKGKGVITPRDFLDAVKDVTSDYSYAGTYLKETCDKTPQAPRLEHLLQ